MSKFNNFLRSQCSCIVIRKIFTLIKIFKKQVICVKRLPGKCVSNEWLYLFEFTNFKIVKISIGSHILNILIFKILHDFE